MKSDILTDEKIHVLKIVYQQQAVKTRVVCRVLHTSFSAQSPAWEH